MPAHTALLVWCGNGHLTKTPINDWLPMGYQFQKHSGMDPFVIDQTRTVKFGDDIFRTRLVEKYSDELAKLNGTAGFLSEEAPSGFRQNTQADALLFSTQNEME